MSDETIDFEETTALQAESELTPPDVFASNLVEWAIERHASDLFLSDEDDGVLISARRLGRVQRVRKLTTSYGRRLQNFYRATAGTDIGDSIHPSDGRGRLTTPSGRNVDLRLSSMPTLYGMDVAIRLFDHDQGIRKLSELGLDASERDGLRGLLNRTSGLILVAGPVASGKSSMMYACLDHLNDGKRKIHTLEEPVEYTVRGLVQSQVNLKAGLDFADLLYTCMRHSPDVIMIGEIRDARTAEIAVRAGGSGQLVLATVHAHTAVSAIQSMLSFGVNRQFLAGSLIGVASSRLVRQLCPDCREPIQMPASAELPDRVAEHLDGQTPSFYRPVGCESCHHDGYQSLSSLLEILQITPDIARAISEGVSAESIQETALQDGMVSLAQAGLVRIARGETTAREMCRLLPDPILANLAAHEREIDG